MVEFVVSLDVYPLEVIYQTSYWFTSDYYVWLAPTDEGVLIRIAGKSEPIDTEAVKGEFCNALIDHALRRSVAQQTAGVREVLLRAAFDEARGKAPDAQQP